MQHCQVVVSPLFVLGRDTLVAIRRNCFSRLIARLTRLRVRYRTRSKGPVRRSFGFLGGFPPSEIGANLAAAVTFITTDPAGSYTGTATPGSFHIPFGHQPFEYGGLMLLSRGQNEGHRLAPALHSYVDFRSKASP